MRFFSQTFIGLGACAVLAAACAATDGGVTGNGPPKKGVPDGSPGGDVTISADGTPPTQDGSIPTDRTPGPDGTTVLPDGNTVPDDGGAPLEDGATPPPPEDSSVTPGPDGSVTPPTDGGRMCDARETCNNGIDDNCNGMLDEGCACLPGMMQRCYDGPSERAGRGVCTYGTMRCTGDGEFGTWSACEGSGQPRPVVCGMGLDFNCNGRIDEGCTCTPGMTRQCYSGPTGTQGVGTCRAGMQTCTMTSTGSAWGACTGEVTPAQRDQCDGVDRDCDGNSNTNCTCMRGATRACYTGPAGTLGMGTCRAGTQTCTDATSGTGTVWGACMGQTLPARDLCDGMDRDCDGNPNTGCGCTVGMTRACYSGPSGTSGVGACRAGTQTCAATSTGSAWGACTGEVVPTRDTCDGVDRDCDRNNYTGCVCMPGMTRPCYSGPTGTQGVGICMPGTQTCVAFSGGVMWGACLGEIRPQAAEVCNNRVDDNCNGMVDEGCVTMPMCPIGFDLLNDANNCGACGRRCAADEACANGVCVGNGQLRITMTWNVRGDMDLHVVPPCGTEIYYGRLTACGGTLDVDSCPAQSPAGTTDPCTGPENVFWPSTPANGTYHVCANNWALSSAVTFRVTVTRGTTVIRTWTGSRSGSAGYRACSPSSPAYIGSFTIP